MGFQLWYSKETGKRRNGTTFTELQDIFINNITTKYIYETLACCTFQDPCAEVLQTLQRLDFDILGVIENDQVIGYIKREELPDSGEPVKNYVHKFNENQVISYTSPLIEVFTVLGNEGFIFTASDKGVEGIVAKADVNKPIVRMYLFGVISLFELHLNYWITEFYQNENWANVLKEERLVNAQKLFEDRKGHNLELTLLECLQIGDKKYILGQSDEFRQKFNFSKGKLKDLLEHMETIRNEVAHSQNSIISNLSWEDFVKCINGMTSFLEKSENEVVK